MKDPRSFITIRNAFGEPRWDIEDLKRVREQFGWDLRTARDALGPRYQTLEERLVERLHQWLEPEQAELACKCVSKVFDEAEGE